MGDSQRMCEGIQAGPCVVPGVYNALTARLAEEAGFKTVYVDSRGVSDHFMAEPDIDFLSFEQLRLHVEQIALSTRLKIIVDFADGYGLMPIVARHARQLHLLQVAGVVMDDRIIDRFIERQNYSSVEDMVHKLKTVREICHDTVLIARTDVCRELGLTAAMERTKAYRDAGADITLIGGLSTVEQLKAVSALPWPQAIHIKNKRDVPSFGFADLGKFGFSLALLSDFASRMAMKTLQIAYKTVVSQGDARLPTEEMIDEEERERLLRYSSNRDLVNSRMPL